MTDQPPRSPGKFGTLRVLTLLALAAAWIGCAGNLDPEVASAWVANRSDGGAAGTGGGPICDAPAMIITPRCTIGCHSPGATLGTGLDLTASVVVMNLLGRMAGNGDSLCGAQTVPFLMQNSNPATGLFIDKLFAATVPCGTRMPIGLMVTGADETCVRNWATAVTTGRVTP